MRLLLLLALPAVTLAVGDDQVCTTVANCGEDCAQITIEEVSAATDDGGMGADCQGAAAVGQMLTCVSGNGACQDQVCTGTLDDCQNTCADVTVTEQTPKSTGGAACDPVADTVLTCANSNGACVDVDQTCEDDAGTECEADCSGQSYTVSELTAAIAAGAACSPATGSHACAVGIGACTGTAETCTDDKDTECTSVCAGETYTLSQDAAATGDGATCAAVDQACEDGDGACLIADQTCTDVSDCTIACEQALAVVEKTAATGGGGACSNPAAGDTIACVSGNGACAADADQTCTDTDDCTSACEEALAVVEKTAATGGGGACSNPAAGETIACANGNGACVKVDATCTSLGAGDCTADCGTLTQTKVPLEGAGDDCTLPEDHVCVGGENNCVAIDAVCANVPAACEIDCASLVMTATAVVALGGGAECADLGDETVCTQGDGACDTPAVDCVGSWADCLVDCEDVAYTVDPPAQFGGTACDAADGDTKVCAENDGACATAAVDCAGDWSTCGDDCVDATFIISQEANTNGADCLDADGETVLTNASTRACANGDDACVSVDCVGAYSACGADCADSTFVESVAQAGVGAGCGTNEDVTCNNGDGACVDVDCAGTWSACAETCADKTFTVDTAKDGLGDDCVDSDAAVLATGSTAVCVQGDGACDLAPVDCVGSYAACAEDCLDVEYTVSAVVALYGGQACEAATGDTKHCQENDGACAIAAVDCAGTWGACLASCDDVAFTISNADLITVNGADCLDGETVLTDASTKACADGDGACVAADCVGAFAECGSDCAAAAYAVASEATGAGAACAHATGDTQPCYPADGSCPGVCVGADCDNSVDGAEKYCDVAADADAAVCVACPENATAALCDGVTDATDGGKADCKTQCYSASGGGSDTKSDAASLSLCLAAAMPLAFLL